MRNGKPDDTFLLTKKRSAKPFGSGMDETLAMMQARSFLLHVYREKLVFPKLKAAVKQQSNAFGATVVLIEDKASGQSLLQELQAVGFHLARPAPALDGDKLMRLNGRTAKIYNGVAVFPTEAPWLSALLAELFGIPERQI